jgi:hypothetical protein
MCDTKSSRLRQISRGSCRHISCGGSECALCKVSGGERTGGRWRGGSTMRCGSTDMGGMIAESTGRCVHDAEWWGTNGWEGGSTLVWALIGMHIWHVLLTGFPALSSMPQTDNLKAWPHQLAGALGWGWRTAAPVIWARCARTPRACGCTHIYASHHNKNNTPCCSMCARQCWCQTSPGPGTVDQQDRGDLSLSRTGRPSVRQLCRAHSTRACDLRRSLTLLLRQL